MAGYWWGVLPFGTGLSWMWNIFGPLSLLLWGILAVFPAMFGWLVALALQRGMKGWGLALEPWPLVSWVGVYGLGFLSMLTLAAILFKATGGRWLILIWIMITSARVPDQIKADSQVKVVAVQAEGATTETYMTLVDQAPDDTQLIVWPENTIPIDVRNVAHGQLEKVQAFALKRKALVVFGTLTRIEGPKWQNTALTVDGTKVLGEHGKNHTVHLFNDGEHGTTALPVVTPLGKVGTPICFDCDFQDVVRKMTLAGAEFLPCRPWMLRAGRRGSMCSTRSFSVCVQQRIGAAWWWPLRLECRRLLMPRGEPASRWNR
jgi:apolipoprotein N-acyltransferase